ncbi:MAG TPA: hypothetical protein VEW05_04520 [Candidatus Polarisedimenticolia bacterium]|nr:hypothetical protein [Candidatus Polarisedimenticolia bacterium]
MIANWLRLQLILLIVVLFNFSVSAQTGGSGTSQAPATPEAVERGGYVVHQSVEIGYRVSDLTGSEQMYNSLVNLRTGPRFLEQSLSMQSQTHDSLFFDNLFINSFGWGGDPNNGLRARVDKNNWYDFRANFRRDQTDFDYNLLANPLNPPTSSPSIPVTFSPHNFATRRRMSDFDLTLLPQSTVDFRIGYSRNNMTGPSYSSVHEGTDALLYQAWNTTLNSYRVGADVKLLPRTVISYDQFLDYYKGDTTWQLAPFAQALLPGAPGTVELGLPVDTSNKNPCVINSPATSLIDSTGTLTNTACNAYFNYNRSNRIRTSTPTERLSLHSTYFQRLELTASYAYSSADMNAPLNESFNGLIQRSSIRQETVTGPGQATRISNVADFSATVHLSEHFRFVDTFRFWSYRIPERFNSIETDSTCTDTTTCSLLTPLSATTQSVTNTADQLSFNQSWKRNQVDFVWDASKHFGGRIGFRYGDKVFHHVLDFTTGDEDRIVVHEYTPLIAFWAKPAPGLRFNFDWEHTNNDNAIVRIGTRKETRYRIQSNYTPKPWAVIAASINVWEASNGDALTDYRGHNRNYGFTANLTPRERFGFDFAYNYNDTMQNAFICFNDSDTSLPLVANAGNCTINGYNDTKNPLLTDGRYTNSTHYGMASVMFKPQTRVTAQVGYGITSTDGRTPQFNTLQPLGSLQYNYYQPLANIAVDLGHNLTAKAAWNYYQFGEGSFVGPTNPRYFHANNATFSLRWAF